MQKELNIKKLILLIMLISLIWAGGYYEYTSAILGGFVMVCFVYAFVKVKGDKKRSSKVELNSGIIFSEMLTLFYGVSIFYATYSALAKAACQEGKIDKVAEYEKKAIERNKFDKEQYVEYLYLLNDMLGNKKIADNDKITGKIIKKMKEVPGLIEKNRKTVSKLGKKINDKVDIELDKELLKEIQEL